MEIKKKRIITITVIVIIIILLMFLSFCLGSILSSKNNINDDSPKNKKSNKVKESIKISPTPDFTHKNMNSDKSETDNKKKEVVGNKFFQSFKSSSGVESLYHLYGNMEINSDTGLMVYLHGDGAQDFNSGVNSEVLNKLMDVGKKNNLLPVAVKTPAFDLTWWKEGSINAKYLNDFFVEYLFPNFNINKNRVLLVGYSGGSELITEFFMLNYAQNLFNGGTILFGGGSVQYSYNSNIQYNENFKKLFKIHYYAGTMDFMYEKSKYAADFFKKEGFNVSTDYPVGEDHYDLPMDTVVGQQLKSGIISK